MSMQGPSNLSNACTSMTAKEQKWKQDGLSKRTPHAHLFWTQNTDLQSNPFRFEASTEATEIIFLICLCTVISLCTVIWRNKINEIHTWPQEKKYKSQIHTTLALKDHLKAVCDKQAVDKKLMLLTPSKSTGHTSRKNRICWKERAVLLKLHCGDPLQPMLLASCVWPPVTKRLLVLNSCSLRHGPQNKQRPKTRNTEHLLT